MNNLVLPICPRCNDTKNVDSRPSTHCLIYTATYACTDCKIRWDSTHINKYSGQGGRGHVRYTEEYN